MTETFYNETERTKFGELPVYEKLEGTSFPSDIATTTGVVLAVPWATTDFIDWSGVADTITIKSSGTYQVEYLVYWDDNTAGSRLSYMIIDSDITKPFAIDIGSPAAIVGVFKHVSKYCTNIYLKAGQTIKLLVLQNSGATVNILAGGGGYSTTLRINKN